MGSVLHDWGLPFPYSPIAIQSNSALPVAGKMIRDKRFEDFALENQTCFILWTNKPASRFGLTSPPPG